jgi:hypothetical protein
MNICQGNGFTLVSKHYGLEYYEYSNAHHYGNVSAKVERAGSVKRDRKGEYYRQHFLQQHYGVKYCI